MDMQTLDIISNLYCQYALTPKSITASVEGGTCITYGGHGRSLIIESYDDLDVALIVTDNICKETVYNEDVEGMYFSQAVAIYDNLDDD
jgi:hypothetical protein